MRVRSGLFLSFALLSLAWDFPARAEPLTCAAPLKPMLRNELYFGRNIGGRAGVGERQWQAFVNRELTPRFPDGLTVIDGQGQWREGGGIVRERSKIVVIVTADDAEARTRVAAAAAAYKARFGQRSVGVVTQPVCAAF
ncbi:MAG: DUF3574 domain-containing protein [Pseudolabrys sp.]